MRGWALLWLVACGARTAVDDAQTVDASVIADASIKDTSSPDTGSVPDASVVDDASHAACDVGTLTVLASGQTPSAIAIDATHVYWLNHTTLSRIPKKGGLIEVLATDEGSFTGQRLLLDDSGMIGTQYNAGGGVWRLPKSQSSVAHLLTLPWTLGIAMDTTTLYFASEYAATLWSLPKSGGTPTLLATTDKFSEIVDVATDGAQVYFTEVSMNNGGVFGIATTGGALNRIVSGDARVLIVDGPDLIFTESGGGVWRLPNRHAPGTRLALVPIPHALAADAEHVYAASLTPSAYGGGVYRMDKQGKSSMRIVARDDVRDVAVDDACVYGATAAGEIFKAPK